MPSLYGPSLLWAELTRYLSDLSIFYKKNVPVEKLVMLILVNIMLTWHFERKIFSPTISDDSGTTQHIANSAHDKLGP